MIRRWPWGLQGSPVRGGEAEAALGWTQLIPAAPTDPTQGTAEPRSRFGTASGKAYSSKGKNHCTGHEGCGKKVREATLQARHKSRRRGGGAPVTSAGIPKRTAAVEDVRRSRGKASEGWSGRKNPQRSNQNLPFVIPFRHRGDSVPVAITRGRRGV